MHLPDEVLWGNAPGPGPALRKAVERTTRKSSQRAWPAPFYLWCLMALVVFFVLGTIRLLIFGPWWATPRTSALSSPAAPLHRQAVPAQAKSHPRLHAKQQAAQSGQTPR